MKYRNAPTKSSIKCIGRSEKHKTNTQGIGGDINTRVSKLHREGGMEGGEGKKMQLISGKFLNTLCIFINTFA